MTDQSDLNRMALTAKAICGAIQELPLSDEFAVIIVLVPTSDKAEDRGFLAQSLKPLVGGQQTIARVLLDAGNAILTAIGKGRIPT